MNIVVNGKPVAIDQPRLRWIDIGTLAQIRPVTNTMKVTYKLPDADAAKVHKHGYSLIVVEGMEITASR